MLGRLLVALTLSGSCALSGCCLSWTSGPAWCGTVPSAPQGAKGRAGAACAAREAACRNNDDCCDGTCRDYRCR